MQPRVIGLDLSLAATGYADFTHDGQMLTTTIRSTPAEGVTGQHTRLARIVFDITELISYGGPHPALVVIEGPSYGSKGAGTWDRAGLWWLLVDRLVGRHHPFVVVPPAVLKKYAAGRGNATKTDMAVALAKRMNGFELRDDNQVDAWWLGAAGRQHLGCPVVEVPKTHREALAKVDWPEVGGR
jgi:Holliday junction resolvasome RuvABC endonuclease subunit